MINTQSNMKREQIFKELPVPSGVEEVTNALLYKAVFIAIKLLLDVRLNLVKISEGKNLKRQYPLKRKQENAVIKDTDTIK